MDKIIVFEKFDFSLGVIHPTLEALGYMSLEEIAAKDVPEGLNWYVLNASDLPSNRDFRSEWRLNEDKTSIIEQPTE